RSLYREADCQVMTEVVLSFDRGAGFSSGIIEFFGSGDFSHVDNVVPEGLLGARSDKIGGQPRGVRVRPEGYQEALKAQVRMAVRCTEEQRQTWLTFLRLQIGKEYDSAAIWAFVLDRQCPAPSTPALSHVC